MKIKDFIEDNVYPDRDGRRLRLVKIDGIHYSFEEDGKFGAVRIELTRDELFRLFPQLSTDDAED